MRIWQLRLVLRLFLLGLVVVSFPGLAQTEAQSHADIGIQFARAGDLVRAADELRKAVMLAPTNAELLSTLGTVLAMDKKLEESTTTFRKALQLAPQDPIVRRYLAANLWQLHRYSEAKRELQIILREHPDDAQARLLLGMVSENSGDYVTAANMLSSVPKEVEKQPESIAALARSYYYLHDREKGRATLQMLTSHASSVQSVLMGAQIADQAGDYEKAEQLLDSIGDSSDGENVRYRKATVQYHRGHFADCEQTLHPVLDRPGASAATYNLLGWCYHRLNKPKEATAAFEQAIALRPADESNYVDLIKVLEAHNFLRVGLDAAKRASDLFPNSAAIFNLKGSIESRFSQFTDAITSYKHSVDIQSTSSEGWLGLGRAQVSAGLILDATSTFTSAMERFPKEMRLKVVYAEMLLKHADPSDRTAGTQAEQLLKQAVANDATNPEAFFELGKIELDDGRLTDASQHLERAAKLLPQSSQVHYVLSRAYRRLNRTADAQRELETYQRLKRGRAPESQNGSLTDDAKP